MNRLQRLSSALVILLRGCLFLALWLLTSYSAFWLGCFSLDKAVVAVLVFALALFAGCGLIGGLYLLLRVFV
jgi:uncharacterized membrane protein (DUF485 family)